MITLFGDEYAGAAIVMQLYMLVVIRECFDFSPALRARARTVAARVRHARRPRRGRIAVLFPLLNIAGDRWRDGFVRHRQLR